MSTLGWFWHLLDGSSRSWAMVGSGDSNELPHRGWWRGCLCRTWSVQSPMPCHRWPCARRGADTRWPTRTGSTATTASGDPWGVLAGEIGGGTLSSNWRACSEPPHPGWFSCSHGDVAVMQKLWANALPTCHVWSAVVTVNIVSFLEVLMRCFL